MKTLATATIEQEAYGEFEDRIRVSITFDASAQGLHLDEKELLIARALRAVAALRGTRFDIAELEEKLRADLAVATSPLH